MNELARIESEQHGPICLVRIYGEIDMSNDREVLSAIEVSVARGTLRVVVDLTDTTYLDSAGLALVLRLADRLQARQKGLSIVVPDDSPVRTAFELTGLPRVIDVESRLEDAMSDTTIGYPNDQV